MPHADANGIKVFYESFGDEGDPAMVLVMGFATQMLGWDEGLCRMLAARGLRVVRFDNRDVGLSTRCDAPYALDDMAADVAGLLDALGVASAHVVGASMGGMIVQLLTIARPERVRSLASIMSSTGEPGVGWPTPEAMAALTTPPPAEREGFLDHMVGTMKVFASPGYPPDEAQLRERIAAGYERSYNPAGAARQFQALISAWDRTAALAKVAVPTVVIHGDDDPLVQPDAGRATAKAIPGARLVAVPGMAHDLPRALWPTLVDAITENARRAGA